jgi:hypothetical protein
MVVLVAVAVGFVTLQNRYEDSQSKLRLFLVMVVILVMMLPWSLSCLQPLK